LAKVEKSGVGLGKFSALVLILFGVIILLFLLALHLGTMKIPMKEVSSVILGVGGSRISRIIILETRLPRALLGILGGVTLGITGTMLQDSMRNPLAGPDLLGVSAGAAVFMAAAIVFRLPIPYHLIPFVAFIGGAIAGGIILFSASVMKDIVRVVLIGAALGALFNALVIGIISFGTRNDIAMLFSFLSGSLSGRLWNDVFVVLPWFIITVPISLFTGRVLNLLKLGDEIAKGLGLKTLLARLFIMALSVALATSVVAVAGVIGYVALLAPHVCRRLLGSNNSKYILVQSALVGSIMVQGADLLAREALAPLEVPIGIWTAILGGIPLLIILRRQLLKV
jgi:iron complex transport system permease protein